MLNNKRHSITDVRLRNVIHPVLILSLTDPSAVQPIPRKRPSPSLATSPPKAKKSKTLKKGGIPVFQKGPEDPSHRDSDIQGDDLSNIPLTSGPLSAEALKKAKTAAAEETRLHAECKARQAAERKAEAERHAQAEAARQAAEAEAEAARHAEAEAEAARHAARQQGSTC